MIVVVGYVCVSLFLRLFVSVFSPFVDVHGGLGGATSSMPDYADAGVLANLH